MKTPAMLAFLLVGSGLFGCAREKIVTITFPKKDGNSEYWVCDRDALSCHGRGEGDLDPLRYKPGLDTLSPPAECDHGAARIEILVKGNQVVQVGYECALPPIPTGLGEKEGGAADGTPTDLPDAPTGLPDAPPGLPAEDLPGDEDGGPGEAERSEPNAGDATQSPGSEDEESP